MTITAGGKTAEALWQDLKERIAAGERFAGLSIAPHPAPAALDQGDNSNKRWALSAYAARPGGVDILTAALPAGAETYPALTPRLGAAFWYERVIHDQTGLIPEGHPRLTPLVSAGHPDDYALPRHVGGYGLFTIPHGPVRSGVFESMEYLVETPGEAIPHLNMRIFYKHRAIASRFEGAPVPDGVLIAERAEGIASVAHALAFCHAIETLSGTQVPRGAALVRVIHAELERIANHLDVAMRLADAAGLAVATARLALHKEKTMRLVSALCGTRFGRGVVVVGGVAAPPRLAPGEIIDGAATLEKAITADAESLMGTSSFLDRLRGTGPLTPERAREHGALGPIGKASGYADDARTARPYDAYPLADDPPPAPSGGDALARLRVRWSEVAEAFRLVRHAAYELHDHSPERINPTPQPPPSLTVPDGSTVPDGRAILAGGAVPDGGAIPDGRAIGWAEAPQGEVLYDVTVADGRIARCHPRSASFHNLVLMHEVFQGDVLTDFPFIEASFGLSVAGAAL